MERSDQIHPSLFSFRVYTSHYSLQGGDKVYLDNTFRHGANVALMLADILLSRVPLVSYHVQVSVGNCKTALKAEASWVRSQGHVPV